MRRLSKLPTYALAYSLTCILTHILIHLLTHSLVHGLTHLLTILLTCLLAYFLNGLPAYLRTYIPEPVAAAPVRAEIKRERAQKHQKAVGEGVRRR